MKGTIIHTI